MANHYLGSPTLQSYILKTLALVTPFDAVNYRKIRVGGNKDGGYVMIDDVDRVTVCYSLGVGPDVTWDEDMARRGAAIYQYDHTVSGPPSKHRNFHFFNIGITHDETIDLGMKRIDSLILENGHVSNRNMLLKIDIEGHEWDVLAHIDARTLEKFAQIVVEFHGLRLLADDEFRERADRVFRVLNETHRVIHVHGNNFAGFHTVEGVSIADCIELSFASRAIYEFTPSVEVFPTIIDAPCNAHLPDLFLGNFRFS